jgi:hypothetical protein
MLGETFVWHVRLEAEKSLQEALQQIQQLKNEIDALKQRLEAGSVDSGAVQYSRWENPLGEATRKSPVLLESQMILMKELYHIVSIVGICWNWMRWQCFGLLESQGTAHPFGIV